MNLDTATYFLVQEEGQMKLMFVYDSIQEVIQTWKPGELVIEFYNMLHQTDVVRQCQMFGFGEGFVFNYKRIRMPNKKMASIYVGNKDMKKTAQNFWLMSLPLIHYNPIDVLMEMIYCDVFYNGDLLDNSLFYIEEPNKEGVLCEYKIRPKPVKVLGQSGVIIRSVEILLAIDLASLSGRGAKICPLCNKMFISKRKRFCSNYCRVQYSRTKDCYTECESDCRQNVAQIMRIARDAVEGVPLRTPDGKIPYERDRWNYLQECYFEWTEWIKTKQARGEYGSLKTGFSRKGYINFLLQKWEDDVGFLDL